MSSAASERRGRPAHEWLSFLVFTLIILPALAVAFVGTYGFVVWMSHEIYGPPSVSFEAPDTPDATAETGGFYVAPTDGEN